MIKSNLAVFLLLVNIAYPLSKPLSKDELSSLNNREIVIREIPQKKGPWPIFEMVALVDFDVLTGMAIFAAYPYQKEYVPNVIMSDVVSEDEKGIAVSYELKTPWPLSNSRYTNFHILKELEENHLKVSWQQLKSTSTKDAKGYAEFKKLNDKTLFVYRSEIYPDSAFAGFVESTAKADIKATMQAIIDHTYYLIKKNPKKTGLLKKDIIDQLDGKKVYIP